LIFSVSADDPRVDDYRAIPDPELLHARGLFVAEGRLVVARLLRSVRFRTRSLLVSPATLDALRASFDLDALAAPIYVADTATLSTIGGFNFHRGCLALGERPTPPTLSSVLPPTSGVAGSTSGVGRSTSGVGATDTRRRLVVVVLEGLAQPDNVGSIFRNAHAFGAAAVLLDAACCDPLYRKALRTSIGAALEVPFARIVTDDLRRLQSAGYRLVALTPTPDVTTPTPDVPASTPDVAAPTPDVVAIEAADLSGRIALMAGAEGQGLSDAWLAAADLRVRIPMAPGADSLNVATATGIALHRCFATPPSALPSD
jgi:tRNA G18 (ribose-2'-O)-methylase SpoU